MTVGRPVALKRLATLTGLAAICLSLAASPALAGKGGPGTGTGGTSTSGWISASPNPASAWGTRVDLAGCGFAFAPAEVRVIHSAGYTNTYMVAMWSTGCMDTAYFTTSEPGTYRIEVYQKSGTKRTSTTVLKASTTLTVT